MTNELVMCPRGGRPCTLAHCPTSGCFLSPGSVRIGPLARVEYRIRARAEGDGEGGR